MKFFLIYTIIGSILFSGCSTKNGAIVGGTTGVIVGGLLGAGISKQHVGNGQTAQTALAVGLVLGLAGALVGGGVGYVVDGISDDDNDIQEIIESQNVEVFR